ncbi:MAG: response regulator [Chloroflexi bacterium]|nr:response regulator [Chloroflexota bacterium]
MMAQTKQALIVDEDHDTAGELKELLDGMGFEVTTLEDPSQATETLEANQYEVALMNMTLPDMTWRKTFRIVKSVAHGTTVIMMARSANEDDIRSALNAGAYVVLERPLSQEQMNHVISPRNDGMFVLLRD